MKGNIYPKGKCPICGGKFVFNGKDLECPEHKTRPQRYFIQIYSKRLKKPIPIYSDHDEKPFRDYESAFRILTTIRNEVDRKKAGDFDPSQYVSTQLKPFRLFTYCETWIGRKKIEVEKLRRSPSYLKTLRVYVRKWKDYFGDVDIRQMDTAAIQDFSLSLKGSSSYVKKITDALHGMLNEAYQRKEIQEVPTFKKIEVIESDRKIIDLDTQDQIINSIPDQMDRAFILFSARAMVRPSETRALWWTDLDLNHDKVTIQRHFSLNELRPATKAKRIKRLPIDGETKKTLQSLPRHMTSPFVFWKRNGRPFSESWARKIFKKYALALGYDISLYEGTRHSSATEAVNRVGVDAVQEFLDHTSRAMTKRYAQVSVESKKKVLRHSG